MKHRFIVLNIVIILLFGLVSVGFNYYYQFKDFAIGKTAKGLLDSRESLLLDNLATIKLSVYSINANELSRVREDILTKYTEDNFHSLIIQPKASFIDTLLYDSKLKQYLDQGKSSQSLLNKMKLYLPNELLISFLRENDSTERLISIEAYLTENGYDFISSSNIPSVKSNIKHYYYDKNLFSDLILQFDEISKERTSLGYKRDRLFNIEIATYLFLLINITLLIQLLDFYLFTTGRERLRFLLKGHLNPRTYHKKTIIQKNIGLAIIIIIALVSLLLKLSSFTKIYLNSTFIVFVLLLAVVNSVIFNFKKERIIKLS